MKLFTLARLILVAMCSTVHAGPLSLMQAQQAIIHHYESGEFAAECAQAIDAGLLYLQKHEHQFNEHKTIVFDIDDTIFSYYDHLKNKSFCTYCPNCGFNAYFDWLQKAEAVEIAHVKRLYDYCVNKGYHIILLSGRQERYKQQTLSNLVLRGYTTFDRIILKSEHEKQLPASLFKAKHRAALVAEGFIIVASVGDQATDFVGGNTGYAIRLPNYIYTSS